MDQLGELGAAIIKVVAEMVAYAMQVF